MSTSKFKAGDRIEGIENTSRGRVISVEPEGYIIFWIGIDAPEKQFELHSFQMIDACYEKRRT